MESEKEFTSKCRDALAMGRSDEFSKNVASWVQRFGKNANNLPFIGISHYLNGDYKDCIEKLSKPGVKQEYKIYAVFSYIMLGQYQEAKAVLDGMIAGLSGDKKIAHKLHVFKEIVNAFAGENIELSWERDKNEILDFLEMMIEKEEEPFMKNSMLLLLNDLRMHSK